jgi:hypothetical protein
MKPLVGIPPNLYDHQTDDKTDQSNTFRRLSGSESSLDFPESENDLEISIYDQMSVTIFTNIVANHFPAQRIQATVYSLLHSLYQDKTQSHFELFCKEE